MLNSEIETIIDDMRNIVLRRAPPRVPSEADQEQALYAVMLLEDGDVELPNARQIVRTLDGVIRARERRWYLAALDLAHARTLWRSVISQEVNQ